MGLEASFNGDLKSIRLPRIPISLTLSHEKIRIGQVAYVIARHKGLLAAVDVKIMRIERHLKEPGRTRIAWGDPLPRDSQHIRNIERMADWRDRRRRKLDRGRGPATVTVASEETSAAPWYARYIVRAGVMLNDVFSEILALLPAGGGHVVFMEGTYYFDSDIVIDRDNVHIKGQGEGTKFVLMDETEEEVRGIYAENKAGIEVVDLSMDGRREMQDPSKHRGIHLISCADFTIRNVTIQNFSRPGIRISTCRSGQVLESNIENCTYGIYVDGAEGCFVEDIIISGNVVRDNTLSGIYVSFGNNISINGNVSRDNIGYGLWLIEVKESSIVGNVIKGAGKLSNEKANGVTLDACHQNTITGNNSSENNLQGIQARTGSTQNIFSGNTCDNNGQNGIFLSAYEGEGAEALIKEECKSVRNVVSNNQCNNNAYRGINVHVGDYNNIQNNTCHNNAYQGIRVSNHEDVISRNNVVTNNDLYGNELGGLNDSGIGTVTDPGNRQ